MRWHDLLGYFHTWSALHNHHEKYPEDVKKEEDPRFLEQDIMDNSEPAHPLAGWVLETHIGEYA